MLFCILVKIHFFILFILMRSRTTRETANKCLIKDRFLLFFCLGGYTPVSSILCLGSIRKVSWRTWSFCLRYPCESSQRVININASALTNASVQLGSVNHSLLWSAVDWKLLLWCIQPWRPQWGLDSVFKSFSPGSRYCSNVGRALWAVTPWLLDDGGDADGGLTVSERESSFPRFRFLSQSHTKRGLCRRRGRWNAR